MGEEMPPIGDEIKQQLERLRQQAAGDHDVWTEEDRARLQQELASIEPNPLFVNSDFPDIDVLVGGAEMKVHNVNNFLMILGVMDKLVREEEVEGSFERLFAELAPERKYREIFSGLQAAYPALYKKMLIIQQAGLVPKSKEDQDEEAYQKSQAYTAAAYIALKLDPNYDLALLTRT